MMSMTGNNARSNLTARPRPVNGDICRFIKPPNGGGSRAITTYKGRSIRCGMTLVEVLVSAVLLGVGVAGMMSAASLSMRNQLRSDQRSVGLGLAQEKLAEIEMLGPDTWIVARPTEGSEDRGGCVYNWSTQIAQETAYGRLYSVKVEVTWSTPRGGDSVELETLLNGYGEVKDQKRKQSDDPAQTNAPSS